MPRTAAGNFPAASGGKIALAAGDTATFAASSVVEASSGAPYTGTVTVYATYLNPTDPNLYKEMPGDLRGIGSNGYETALQTFGMTDVEMQDASGNALQLASGQQATLTGTIPDSLLSAAPATVPLWYFNDTTGRWIEQGTAVKQGNAYIGQVGHFTYWGWSETYATVNFTVHVVDQYGNPLAYHYIDFSTSSGYRYQGGYTDSAGYAQGLIPAGLQLVMQVLDECGGFIGGANVGPAMSDQNLGTVTVDIVNAELTVAGNVVNCNNNPVDSGYVMVKVDGLIYQALLTNGAFSLPITRCVVGDAPVQLYAYDYSTMMTSTSTTITANSGTVNAGTLSACSVAPPAQPYLDFTIYGNSFNLKPPSNGVAEQTIELATYNLTIFGASDEGPDNIELFFSGINGTGTFNGAGDSANVSVMATINGINGINVLFRGPITYTITTFGPVGGYIQGSFSGTGNSYEGDYQNFMGTVQLSGTLNVKRVF